MSNTWVPTSSKGSGGGGSGTVTSVASADTSIVVTNPTTTPSLKLATLDVIATNEPPAAAVPMNAQKFTGLANGSAATDSAAFGQIPTALPPNGAAGGVLSGTYPNPGMAAGAAASNLGAAGGDLTGTYPSPTIGAAKVTTAKLAAAVTLDAIATANATAGNVAMNTHKLTGLAAGSGAGDSLRYEQLFSAGAVPIADIADPGAGQVIGSNSGAAAVFPPGYEIQYAAITASVNVASSTESSGTAIISPGAATFDGAPVLCHFWAPGIAIPTATSTNDNVFVCLFESSTQITRLVVLQLADLTTGQQLTASLSGFYRFTPSAGSHTYSVTAFTNITTGTPKIIAGSGGTGGYPQAFIRFTKV